MWKNKDSSLNIMHPRVTSSGISCSQTLVNVALSSFVKIIIKEKHRRSVSATVSVLPQTAYFIPSMSQRKQLQFPVHGLLGFGDAVVCVSGRWMSWHDTDLLWHHLKWHAANDHDLLAPILNQTNSGFTVHVFAALCCSSIVCQHLKGLYSLSCVNCLHPFYHMDGNNI